MQRLPESLINEVRSKIDIVDVISQYIPLTKKGRNYWAVCPFHDDHDPSMSISTDKQIYKCFVCGAGGNAFTFIQNYEKISFVEAVIRAASRVHMDLSQYHAPEGQKKESVHQKLLDALDETQKFTAFQLSTQNGLQARSLLESRGYTEDIIERFGIGVALGDNQILNYLKAKGFSEEDLVEADLIRDTDTGYRDVFYQRLMFPLWNIYGQTIGFSARALSDHNNVKYINTSETVLYTKGNTLYNYHNAKKEVKQFGYVILCEGVTDAIALTQAGFANVVSTLGVACTDVQVKLLKQCSSHVVIAYDGDNAGQDATYVVGQKLNEQGCTVSVWHNASGKDPDEILREYGKETIEAALSNKQNWLDFILEYAKKHYGLQSFESRKRVVEFVLPYIHGMDDLTTSYYVKKVSETTQFDQTVLLQQLKDRERSLPVSSTTSQIQAYELNQTKHKFKVTVSERLILQQMLDSKKAAFIYRDALGFLIADIATDFAYVILDCYRNKEKIELADILSKDIDEQLKEFALELDFNENSIEFDEQILLENIEIVRKSLVSLGVQALKSKGRQEIEIDEQAKLLQEAIEKMRNSRQE